MSERAHATDKIFARPPHYTLHYRRGRRSLWSFDARPDYNVLFVFAGTLGWTGGGETGEARAGGLLLASPGETLTIRAGGDAETLALALAPAHVLDCAARTRLTRADALITFRPAWVADDARLARAARDMADELLEETHGQEAVIAALVEQVTIHLLRRHANIRRSGEVELSRAGLVDRRIRRAVELMHAQLDRELPLEVVASAAHLSPFHFARLFKKLTGATPHAYLASLRAERARALLAETDLSITEVASRVGYASSSHFSKSFRQSTGLSPRAFRSALVRR